MANNQDDFGSSHSEIHIIPDCSRHDIHFFIAENRTNCCDSPYHAIIQQLVLVRITISNSGTELKGFP